MTKFTIWHDRPNCIACAACAVTNPDDWIMDEDGDGRADLKNSKKTEKDGVILKEELDVQDLGENKRAAECCPVNVIHIIDKASGKQII